MKIPLFVLWPFSLPYCTYEYCAGVLEKISFLDPFFSGFFFKSVWERKWGMSIFQFFTATFFHACNTCTTHETCTVSTRTQVHTTILPTTQESFLTYFGIFKVFFSISYVVNVISYLHELDAGVQRVVEPEEQQEILLHGQQLGQLNQNKLNLSLNC